jgi:hypothetical protein
MPKLGDLNADLEKQKLPTGNFQFSAQRIGDLGATEYTLATVVVDVSGSTESFRPEMTKALQNVVESCKYSPRADNLMLRVLIFSNNVTEVHGFKLLQNCNLDDYKDVLNVPGGMTALCDAAVNGIEATNTYGKDLIKQDFAVNGIVVVITDGCENHSTFTVKTVNEKLKEAVAGENLESLISILVAVNVQEPSIKTILDQFHKDAGFTQFVDMGEATPKKLARLGEFISKSISSQSQALGTGGPSKTLTF